MKTDKQILESKINAINELISHEIAPAHSQVFLDIITNIISNPNSFNEERNRGFWIFKDILIDLLSKISTIQAGILNDMPEEQVLRWKLDTVNEIISYSEIFNFSSFLLDVLYHINENPTFLNKTLSFSKIKDFIDIFFPFFNEASSIETDLSIKNCRQQRRGC